MRHPTHQAIEKSGNSIDTGLFCRTSRSTPR